MGAGYVNQQAVYGFGTAVVEVGEYHGFTYQAQSAVSRQPLQFFTGFLACAGWLI